MRCSHGLRRPMSNCHSATIHVMRSSIRSSNPDTLVVLPSGAGPTVIDRARLESLDVFRGLTIAAMILVSTPGTWDAVYPPLDHAAWHGWTPTDLVFPFFLFAMGAAVPFALARRRDGRRTVGRHVVRRAVVLFTLGLVLNAVEMAPL